MLDLELLNQLVAFSKYKTISETAEHLLITQPSVSRNLKKLEDKLGVKLFNRSINKISLTPTGKLAVKEAEELLKASDNFLVKIKNFDQQNNMLAISSVIPGPLMWLMNHHQDLKSNFNFKFEPQLIDSSQITQELLSFKSKLVISTDEIDNDQLESFYLGTEKLSVRIDPFNPLANRKSVSFADLEGMSFLVYQGIGPWRDLSEKYIPNAKFLYQKDMESLDELTQYSNFPVFRSNLTIASQAHEETDDRLPVDIVDPHNQMDFYATYLKEHSKSLGPLLKQISQALGRL